MNRHMNRIIKTTAILASVLTAILLAGRIIILFSEPDSSPLFVKSLQIGLKLITTIFFAVLCMNTKAGSRLFQASVLLLAAESVSLSCIFFEKSSSQITLTLIYVAIILTSLIMSIIGYCKLAKKFSLRTQAGWASLAVPFVPMLVTAALLLFTFVLKKDIDSHLETMLKVILHAVLYIWFFLSVATNCQTQEFHSEGDTCA